jgi:dTDP-4-dehydrorhamnose reductase
MARWAAGHKVPMVHFSTDYVFDGSGSRPWREDDATGPLSVYGASKLAGEIAVREAGGDHLVIRTSWVYASKGNNFLNTVVGLARERSELRMVSDQVGAPTSARSIAEGLRSILYCCRFGARSDLQRKFREAEGLVHLTASGETSRHGFACEIVDGLRKRGERLAVTGIAAIATREFPTAAVRPHNSRLSISRLQAVFSARMPDWRDALDSELDDLVCNRREPSG